MAARPLLTMALLGIAGVLSMTAGAPSVLAVVPMTLGVVAFLFVFQRWLLSGERPKPTAAVDGPSVILLAFAVRLSIALVYSWILESSFGHPFYSWSDDYSYELLGERVGTSGLGVLAGYRQSGFPALIGLLHMLSEPLGGYHFLLPRVVNAGFGALLAGLTVQLADAMGAGRNRQRLLAVVCILFPDYLYYSALTLRDIEIAYLWMLGTAILASRRSARVRAAALLAVVVIMYEFRIYYAVLLAGLIFVQWSVFSWRQHSHRVIALAMLTGALLLGFERSSEVLPEFDPADGFVAEAEARLGRSLGHSFGEHRAGSEEGFSGMQALSKGVPSLLRPTVMAVLHFFAPLPFWRSLDSVGDPFRFMRTIAGGIWFIASFSIAVLLLREFRKRSPSPGMMFIVGSVALPVMASGISYFDIRYRLPAVAPALVLLVVGFDWDLDRRRATLVIGMVALALTVFDVWRSFINTP